MLPALSLGHLCHHLQPNADVHRYSLGYSIIILVQTLEGKVHLLLENFVLSIEVWTVPAECGWCKRDVGFLKHDYLPICGNNSIHYLRFMIHKTCTSFKFMIHKMLHTPCYNPLVKIIWNILILSN